MNVKLSAVVWVVHGTLVPQCLGQGLIQDQGKDQCCQGLYNMCNVHLETPPVSPASYMGLGQKWSRHPGMQLP